MKQFLLLTIFLSFCPIFLYGQFKELKFKHISKEAGLSSSNVTCFAQTNDGLLWVGTADGLNRFDGYSFTVYRNDPDDSLSISDNSISALYVDHKGDLWIGTENNGLCRYNKQTDRFINYKHDIYDPTTLSNYFVTSITEDSNQNLWVGTIMGLNLYNRKQDNFSRYFFELSIGIRQQTIDSLKAHNIPEHITKDLTNLLHQEFTNESAFHTELRQHLSGKNFTTYKDLIFNFVKVRANADHIRALQADKNGNIWIGYDNEGVAYFNPRTSKLKDYQHNPEDPKSIGGNQVISMCLDKENLWIGLKNGKFSKWNAQTDAFENYTFPEQTYNIASILVDSKGIVWIGDDYGLTRFEPNKKQFYKYQNQENDKYSLSATAVKAIYEDKYKNLWIGCSQGGINLTVAETPFEHFKYYPNSRNSLTKNSVSSVLEDSEGNIWIGYFTMGVDVMNKNTNQVRHYSHDPNNSGSLGKGTVFAIFEDRDKNIWLGTYEGGLQQFDKKSKSFVTYKHQPDNKESISGNDIRAFAEDKDGNLWMAIHGNGINAFNKKTKTVKRYNAGYLDWQNSLANDWVFTLYIDKPGNVWVGSVFGLSVLRKGADGFVTYNRENRNLSHNKVRTILEDSKGNIWVGTENGLNLFDNKETNFKVYTEKDGLPNNTINGILEDDHGNLWISTNQGLSRFDTQKGVFTSYTTFDGLQSDEFFPGAYHKGKSGAMYFGGTNGLNTFYTEDIIGDTTLITVQLTGFSLFNKPVALGGDILKKPLDQTNKITLEHNQNTISFSFSGTNFRDPEKIQYAYMLEGFEEEWNYIGAKREAIYTNLSPGEYIFKVKAANSGGLWNEKAKEIKVVILPPIWLSPIAYIVYLMVIMSLIYYYKSSAVAKERIKNKLELQKLEAKKTHELDEVKIKFFTSISHEFRTPLTLILDPIDRLIDEDASIEAGQRMKYYHLLKSNAQRLLRLINQLLDISEMDAGCMKLSIVKHDIVGFCKSIADTFAYRASKSKIGYCFSSNINEAEVYFDYDKLEKIIYNLISNALKFTPAGGNVKLNLLVTDQSNPDIPARVLPPDLLQCQFVHIRVEDTGSGIPEEHLKRVFERFYQVENISARKIGTGIGLALSKQLAEHHKGCIRVESEEGKGSVFSVWIPVSKEVYLNEQVLEDSTDYNKPVLDEALCDTVLMDEPDVAEGESKDMSELPVVLLVEDSDDLRKYLSFHLQQNYAVYEAGCGIEGYKKALEVGPDIIISDVMMPGISGLDMCSKLKNDSRTSHIPIVLLTARSSATYELEGLQMGADDYISKPFSMPVLKTRIVNMLELRRRLKDRLLSDLSFAPKDIATNSLDKTFINELVEKIEQNISDENFTPETLTDLMNLSRSQLYKKVKGLTGVSVSIFIRNLRVRKAAQLLEKQNLTISEVAYSVGFSDPSYFTKCFKELYGKCPSEYFQKSYIT